jgi:hypothetical protein
MADVFKEAENLKLESSVQGANLIVRINKPAIRKYITTRLKGIGLKPKEDRIKILLEEYLNQPQHFRLKSAVVHSNLYNGGAYTSLINELRHGL